MEYSNLTIFVGGFSPFLTESNLRDYFEKYGTICKIILKKDNKKKINKGYAFVYCQDNDTMNRILNNYHEIEGRVVDCDVSNSGTKKTDNIDKCVLHKICIKGVHKDVINKELYAYFSQFGIVKKAFIIYDPITKRSKLFGYVEFSDEHEKFKALAEKNHFLKGKQFFCEQYVPRCFLEPSNENAENKNKVITKSIHTELSREKQKECNEVNEHIITKVSSDSEFSQELPQYYKKQCQSKVTKQEEEHEQNRTKDRYNPNPETKMKQADQDERQLQRELKNKKNPEHQQEDNQLEANYMSHSIKNHTYSRNKSNSEINSQNHDEQDLQNHYDHRYEHFSNIPGNQNNPHQYEHFSNIPGNQNNPHRSIYNEDHLHYNRPTFSHYPYRQGNYHPVVYPGYYTNTPPNYHPDLKVKIISINKNLGKKDCYRESP